MTDTPYFERHPVLTLIGVTTILLVALMALLEITLRFTLSYDIGYYSATKAEGRYEYPFGTILINQDGYPDTEFDRSSSKTRIGYFGDSVTFGTGAGHGYRFSDILEKQYPQYEHWTFAMVNNGIQDMRILDTAEEYALDTVIYAMNMNDIMPISADQAQQTNLSKTRNWIYKYLDDLRGKSYLYTWIRTLGKNSLVRLGFGHMGFVAAELKPTENLEIIEQVMQRINGAATELRTRGIDFCLVLLPYEMQISQEAAATYKQLGINWEKGFLNGSTQTIIRSYFSGPHIYNGIEAFQDVHNPRTGEFFVYNKGDKIDFNHLNRAGHTLLAQGFSNSKSCPVFK